jgi:hypothetical protein
VTVTEGISAVHYDGDDFETEDFSTFRFDEPGDTFIGTFSHAEERPWDDDTTLLSYWHDRQGKAWRIFVYWDVLQNSLKRLNIQPGELCRIVYTGDRPSPVKGRRPYRHFSVDVKRDRPTSMDWSKVGKTVDEALVAVEKDSQDSGFSESWE